MQLILDTLDITNFSTRGTMTLQQLAESDIDRSLVFLISNSSAFSSWFQRRVGLRAEGLRVIRAERSVFHVNGESDVVIEWSGAGCEVTCLAESKFDAVFQQRQGERYASRAFGIAEADPNRMCITVLIAPADYLRAANPHSSWFNARISLEDIADAADAYAAEYDVQRNTLRALLQRYADGGALGAKGLFPTVHRQLSQAAELRNTEFRVNNNSTDWVFFKHPAQVPGLEIRYRIKERCAELAFTSAFRGPVEFIFAHSSNSLFAQSSSGKSHFVKYDLTEVVPSNPLDFEQQHAFLVIGALTALVDWWVTQAHAVRDV